MTATNKRLLISESRGGSNRCIPCRGKPDQHDTYASHASPHTPGIRFLWVVPVRDNLSRVICRFGWIPLPHHDVEAPQQVAILEYTKKTLKRRFLTSTSNLTRLRVAVRKFNSGTDMSGYLNTIVIDDSFLFPMVICTP
jgi:hypothetical protein